MSSTFKKLRMSYSLTVALSRHTLCIKMWSNTVLKNLILSLLLTKGFVLKKINFGKRRFSEKCRKNMGNILRVSNGVQKEAILWVLKYDFRAHKKIGNLFQHIPLNTLVM